MNIAFLLQNIVNGLSIGSVYAIFALGYTLVFSILGIINFAHGAVFTLGAYCTYALAVGDFGLNGLLAGMSLPFRLPFPLALLGGSLLAGVMGVLVERLAFRPLRAKGADPLLALVSSLGVALIIVNCLQFLVGAEIYSFPSDIFGSLPMAMIFKMDGKILAVRTVQLIILAVSLVMLLALAWFMNRTRMGKALQATAENPETASLLGINVDRYILSTFFISGALGGLAGTLIGASFGLAGPYFGVSYGLKGLAVIVLGLGEAFLPSDYSSMKEAVAFILLFVILLARPQGLLGRQTIQKV